MSQIQLPPHWKTIQLGDIVLLKNGINFSSQQKGRGILTVDVLNMYSDSIHLRMDELYRVDKEPGDDYLLQPNDILFVRSSLKQEGVGWSSLFTGFTEPVTFCGFLIRARLTATEISPEFLINYLRLPSVRRLLISKSGKVSITNINQENIKSLSIPIPPLPEQSASAHTLRTIQKAKEARQRELELERERKAALMQYLFTHGTCNEPSKKTKIGEIPQSWRIVMLGDLCLNGLGIIQTGPFGSQLHASDYKSAGIPVVNPTHLRFNSIVDDAIPRISREKADSISKHYLIEGDILISRRGDFSRYSYISQKYSGWFCGTGCLLIRLAHPEVDNYFLSILFSTEVIQNYLKLNAVGSIMPNLNTRILQDVPLTLPKIEQQREIAEVLRSCDRKITALEQEAAFLDELFRATLEELMTGRLSALPLVEEKRSHN